MTNLYLRAPRQMPVLSTFVCRRSRRERASLRQQVLTCTALPFLSTRRKHKSEDNWLRVIRESCTHQLIQSYVIGSSSLSSHFVISTALAMLSRSLNHVAHAPIVQGATSVTSNLSGKVIIRCLCSSKNVKWRLLSGLRLIPNDRPYWKSNHKWRYLAIL